MFVKRMLHDPSIVPLRPCAAGVGTSNGFRHASPDRATNMRSPILPLILARFFLASIIHDKSGATYCYPCSIRDSNAIIIRRFFNGNYLRIGTLSGDSEIDKKAERVEPGRSYLEPNGLDQTIQSWICIVSINRP